MQPGLVSPCNLNITLLSFHIYRAFSICWKVSIEEVSLLTIHDSQADFNSEGDGTVETSMEPFIIYVFKLFRYP